MTAPTPDPDRGSSSPSRAEAASLLLRLVARRHVDLRRVSSALCRPVR